MKHSITLGRIAGIEIGAHISWLVIVLLVTFSLSSYFTATQPDWSRIIQWSAAGITAILFFSSVVIHELAHSLMAKYYGIEVRSITLFLFGGVSQIENDAKRPLEEFWIAIVGPLASFAIAIGTALLGLLFGGDNFFGNILIIIASINLALGVFNLLPGFPLDGGRVLRGIVWWITGNVNKATRIAAAAGQVIAMMMIMIGVWRLFRPIDGFGGIWMILLGWFLFNAARATVQQMEVSQALQNITAADLMTGDYQIIPADLTIDRFVNEYLLRTGHITFLVTYNDDLLGMITLRDLESIDRSRWSELRVANLMRPLSQVQIVSPETTADQILERMVRGNINQIPVIANNNLQGIVMREQIMRLLNSRQMLESRQPITPPTTKEPERIHHDRAA